MGYLCGGVLQYLLCACWVFPGAPRHAVSGFLAFFLLSLVGRGITWVTMATLHDVFSVNYAVAKIASLGLTFGWNFPCRKFLLFRRPDLAMPGGAVN